MIRYLPFFIDVMLLVYCLIDCVQTDERLIRNLHQGKVGVLALAPEEGLGVTDPELREKFEDKINRFRDI